MGFLSDLGDFIVDPFDIVSGSGINDITEAGKGFVDDITGKSAQDAIDEAAQTQAGFQNQILDLLRPTVEAGQAQLDPLAQSATLKGFGANIGDILSSGALDPVIAERQKASQAALAGAGLRRSSEAGRRAAQIPTDMAFSVEQELNRRRGNIAGLGERATGQTAGTLGNIGSILGQGILGGQQAGAAGTQNIMGLLGPLLGAFSDETLKANIENIGTLGDVNIITWEWNEDAYNRFGFSGNSLGFSAQEVEKKHPEFVIKQDGHLAIDYEGLIGKLNG